MRLLRTIACTAIATLAAGCAGPGLAPATLVSAGAATAPRTATVRIVVKILKAHKKRRARYISPGTKSMTFILAPVKGTPLRQTIDLTPTSNGCTSSPAGTVCTRTLNLAPGRYTATVSTYDAVDGGGALLSSGQNLSVNVVVGRVNQIKMTLNGIPHAILVTGLTPGVHGSQSSGFTVFGNTGQKFDVVATDADSDPIVGPGAPTFTASILTGSGWTASTPSPTTPNTLAVTPPAASGLTASVRISATYADTTTCSAAGAVCGATVSLLHHLQNVWVLDSGSNTIDEYAYPYTGTTRILSIADSVGNIGGTNQNAQGFAMDAQGDIFVANCVATCGQTPPDSVTEYAAPGYSSTPVHTITTGVANPEALAVDASGNLFVANQNGSIAEYAPPYTAAPSATITNGIQVPVGLAFDSNNNLYVLNCATSCAGAGSDQILKYAAPYSGTPVILGTIGTPAPGAIVVDSSGNVFAGNAGAVTEYPSGSAVATAMTVNGEAVAIALDDSGNLFAAGCATGCSPSAEPDSLLEFAPPYTGTAKTIDASGGASGFGHVAAVTVDGAGNLIAANGINNTLLVYAWPYSAAPQASGTGASLSGPTGLILTP